MRIEFNPGFTIYHSKKKPAKGEPLTWATPHSGHSFEVPDSRDEETDAIASLCWLKSGGRLVFSDLTRRRDFGIDFNRAAPTLRDSLRYFKLHRGNKITQKEWYDYRVKYAWTAYDRQDHQDRLRIYRGFWKAVDRTRDIILIHRMISKLSNSHSIMDVFGFGVEKGVVDRAVRRANSEFEDFLRDMRSNYLDFVVLDARERFHYLHSRLDVEQEYHDFFKQDLRFLGVKDITNVEFLPKAKRKLSATMPNVTSQHYFSGKLSHGLKNLSSGRRVLQIEVSSFMCRWYPDIAGKIITSIVDEAGLGK